MPLQRIDPNYDFNIDGPPQQITIALAGADVFQQTTVSIGFMGAITSQLIRTIVLNNTRRHTIEGGFPQGTTSLFITNGGPEIIHVSWA
jgi:hypothetical protein